MDFALLDELTPLIEWEGNPRWVPLTPQRELSHAVAVPVRWQSALLPSLPTAQRIQLLWAGVETLLPRTCAVFRAKCDGLALLQTQMHAMSLVYIFDADGMVSARRGFAPASSLPPMAAQLPLDLQAFYNLHDGLVHLASHDGGPMPSMQWRVTADPATNAPGFLTLAMNGPDALGFDLTQHPAQAMAIYPDEEDVALIADAWACLDDWLAGPLEDL